MELTRTNGRVILTGLVYHFSYQVQLCFVQSSAQLQWCWPAVLRKMFLRDCLRCYGEVHLTFMVTMCEVVPVGLNIAPPFFVLLTHGVSVSCRFQVCSALPLAEVFVGAVGGPGSEPH